MIKLIIGTKGTGKTKTLIDLVNTALNTSNGSVVCIEKGDKLRLAINYKCRLIDTEEYSIADGETLYGFVAGILASNNDVTDLFIDSALKICKNDAEEFDKFLDKLDALLKSREVNLVMTSSLAPEDATEKVLSYVK